MKRAALLTLILCAGCAHSGPGPTAELRSSPFIEALAGLPTVGPHPSVPLKGKVTLVAFFTTWCFPCLGAMPVMQKLQNEYGERGLQVVAVGMDVDRGRVLRPFAELYAYPFPILVADEALMEGRSAYGRIASLPTSFLLNREGHVVTAYQGLADLKDLTSYIEKSL